MSWGGILRVGGYLGVGATGPFWAAWKTRGEIKAAGADGSISLPCRSGCCRLWGPSAEPQLALGHFLGHTRRIRFPDPGASGNAGQSRGPESHSARGWASSPCRYRTHAPENPRRQRRSMPQCAQSLALPLSPALPRGTRASASQVVPTGKGNHAEPSYIRNFLLSGLPAGRRSSVSFLRKSMKGAASCRCNRSCKCSPTTKRGAGASDVSELAGSLDSFTLNMRGR